MGRYEYTCRVCKSPVIAENHTEWPIYCKRPRVFRNYDCPKCGMMKEKVE